MSASYRPVGWNPVKIAYDAILLAAVVAYIELFLWLGARAPVGALPLDDQALRMRAFGTCAFLMVSLILCIGPLARLDARFLPLLYNRRHFGVLACLVAFTHASYVLGWYFGYSPVDPYVALLSSNTSFTRIAGFPFEAFGIAALVILLVLAATSHDFWLSFLTPPTWKAIHMSIYAAYALIVAHVALGGMTAPYNGPLAAIVVVSAAVVTGLHLVAARKGVAAPLPANGGWIAVGAPDEIAEGRGRVVAVEAGEAIAVFRHDGGFSALANACAHQNGPLGEGRVIDGCVTCPWHGFQYRVEDGVAPPPYTERLATYRLKYEGGILYVDPVGLPPGTRVAPLRIERGAS